MQHIPDESKMFAARAQSLSNSRRVSGGGNGAPHSENAASESANSSGRCGDVRHMPTPREIMRGLNEYVIGQRNVKVALSVSSIVVVVMLLLTFLYLPSSHPSLLVFSFPPPLDDAAGVFLVVSRAQCSKKGWSVQPL
jgi:hypothetical protein